jgi:putative transposase
LDWREDPLEGCDAKVLSLYARGLSTHEIQGHRAELYGTEVSPTLIGTITDAVLEEVRTGQARPLASVYPILSFDALCVKSRQEGPVQTKAVSLALGVTMDGEKELLGSLNL